MAITDAQQAKQIMMKKGGVPQLVKKGKGKKYHEEKKTTGQADCLNKC